VEEIKSILERGTRNCPWSGDLWGFYLRYLAQLDDYPLGSLAAIKERATSLPWLLTQKPELAKLYYAWISICRLAVVDWDEDTKEGGFIETELANCLDIVGTGNSHHSRFVDTTIAFESSEQYLLGKLIIYIKTLSNKEEDAKYIWNLMSKANSSKCDYWLDRIAWER
jgi:squamous cell carcinoma antigen recognized by T-cells 3